SIRTDAESLPLVEKALDQALNDHNEKNMRLAIHALSNKQGPEAIALLKKVLRHNDTEARIHAASTLRERKDPESLPLIEIALNDPAAAVRIEAARALSRTDPGSMSLLKKAMEDPDPAVRSHAIESLKGRTDPELLSLIQNAARD